jgi:hypothetical protein
MAGRIGYYGGIVTNGLVLDLDAAKKESYSGYGITWSDISGVGNSGTLTNGPIYNFGNGGCFIFDGVDDFCINPLSTGFTQKMTIITIGKSPNSTWGNYAGLGSARVDNGYIIHNNPGSSTVSFYVINSSGSYTDIGSVTPVNIQNFNFYALTTNGTNSHKRYLNGSIVGTSTTSITRTDTGSSQNNWLGSDSGAGGRYNSIIIGAHLVYNRELSEQEISQIYNAYKSRFGM